ncbi:Kappa-carrageenase [Planctomycetes bacterium LzC2]|uniref:Kappa-carrageenase n=2 Tax=Alienimonas chondri TaxID=2681879 RepID=A0ABX1VGF2_9PLAN|nr:Kappa-carrageenase [Alienimonas chondri]
MIDWNCPATCLGGLLIAALAAPACGDDNPAGAPDPVGIDAGEGRSWIPNKSFSDEFEDPKIDFEKWRTDPEHFSAWSWSQKNAFVNGGVLNLRMTREPHERMDPAARERRTFDYKSGILRSRAKTTYGYFEARVRGCARFPGASPAFWLYSQGEMNNPSPTKYCEIDVFELQQGEVEQGGARHGPGRIDMNLHCRTMIDGELRWLRPHSNPELCRHVWDAPFDPRETFHVYGCDVTPAEIVWYVDGVERAREENRHWHLPMFVTLSLGLRTPFAGWRDQALHPVPDAATDEGFPTDLRIDYVRAWTRSPMPESSATIAP